MSIEPGERIAVISDIHGNCPAFRAVLDDIARRGIRVTLALGDYLSGPLEAAKTADLVMSSGIICIRGNHDRVLVETKADDMPPSDACAYRQIGRAHLNWLKQLPASHIYRGEIFLCHGTPSSDTSYWMEKVSPDARVSLRPLAEIEENAKGIDLPILLCGHTHLARIVRLRDGRMLVNPGSVGCPAYEGKNPVPHVMQSGSPYASYAVLEKRGRSWDASIHTLSYANLDMASLANERGRSEWASALATGWIQ